MNWKKELFIDAVSDTTSRSTKIKRGEYLQVGRFPIIDQGDGSKQGFWDHEEDLCATELPVVLFGDHTRKFQYVDYPFVCGADGLKVLKPRTLDEKFLFYQCLHLDLASAGYSRHFKFLKEKNLLVPHLKEQARIVELLDQADALRKLRRQADDKAARILPALFHHYFGDPQKNDKRYPLGRIAEHSTRVTKGESPKWQGFAYQDSGVLFVTSENVRLGSLDISNPKYVAPGFHKKLKRSALIEDDVLVNLVGASIGRCCIYRNMKSPANINQAVAAITLTKDSLLPDFLEALLCQPSMQAKLLGHRVEAARANISLKDVRELEIIIPDIEEQIKFCDAAVAIKETHHAIATSKQKLEDLFQLLLHRAFTGELTAKWREAHLSELVDEMAIQAKR